MKQLRISVLAAVLVAMLIAVPVPSWARTADASGGKVLSGTPANTSAPHVGGDAVPGVFLVKVRPTGKGTVATLDALPGVSAADVEARGDRTAIVKTPKGKSDGQFLQELRGSSSVELAEPNYIRQVSGYSVPPNDPGYASTDAFSFGGPWVSSAKSWWLRDINTNSGVNIASLWSSFEAPTFPARASGSAVKVAVIDTGFYMDHPDKGANIVAGKDEFATYSSATGVTTKDDDVSPVGPSASNYSTMTASHGTCVAGQIGAGTNNGVGVAGVTYDSTVVVYKVQGIWIEGSPTDGYPAGSAVILDSAIIDAIDDATAAGAKIINMSLAGTQYSKLMQDAIDHAWSHGVLVVSASGNTGALDGVQYPGANNHVVGVGSYTLDGPADGSPTGKMRSHFTDYGIGRDAAGAGANNGGLDVLAPGQGVWGLTQPGYDADGTGTVYEPGYYWWSGTSMSSAAFSGMAAAVWRFAPALTPDQLASVFLQSTGSGAWTSGQGYGYVNPTAAYAKLKTDYPYLLAPATLSLPASTNSTQVPFLWSPIAGTAVSYDVSADGVFVKNVTDAGAMLTLGEGSHVVSVTPRSDFNWWDPGTQKSGTVLVDPTLGLGTLSGTVTSGASPLSGVSVSVPGTAAVTTAADGSYSVAAVTPGGYGVTYFKSGVVSQTIPVVINAGITTTRDVSLVPALPVYRFRNKASGVHLYSVNPAEIADLNSRLAPYWVNEDITYYVSTAPASGLLPVYRFRNKASGVHLYSVNPAEIADLNGRLAPYWVNEDITYYVSTAPASGLSPVYRFRNKASGVHLYSVNPAEIADLNGRLSPYWVNEDITYYVSTTP